MDPLLDDLRMELRGDVATVDLAHLRFIRPAHMVGVAARAHFAASFGRPFELVRPRRPDPGHYASRMHLNQILDDLSARHDLPVVRDHANDDLLEVSRITGPGAVRELAALVHTKVFDVDPVLADVLHQSIGELGANVNEHAATVGFVAAQRMPHLNELRFAVADSGAGLRSTLERKGANTDREAVGMALDGVSRFDQPDRGGGLKSAAHAVGELTGSIWIASGSASVQESSTNRSFLESDFAFQGTLIEAVIPLSRGRHARRVSDYDSSK